MFFLGAIIVFLVLFMRNGILGFLSEKLAPILDKTSGSGPDEGTR
jgi:hypothetical protein